jgi:Ca2+-binding RTX toxin-like protein
LGNDTLVGGGGSDTFRFGTSLAANVDTITDFNAFNDKIQLDRSIFTAITALGTLSSTAFVVGAAAADASDRVIYNSATRNLFYDSDGTGASAAVQFAHFNAASSISNTNFNVVA